MKQQPYKSSQNRLHQVLKSEQFPSNFHACFKVFFLIYLKLEKRCCTQLEFWFRNLYTYKVITLQEDGKTMPNKVLVKKLLIKERIFFEMVSTNIDKNLIVKNGSCSSEDPATVKIIKNIYVKLLSYSFKHKNKNNVKEAPRYPLSAAPLCSY